MEMRDYKTEWRKDLPLCGCKAVAKQHTNKVGDDTLYLIRCSVCSVGTSWNPNLSTIEGVWLVAMLGSENIQNPFGKVKE